MRASLVTLALLLASPAFADVEFYQTIDRTKVGTEEVIKLDIVVGDAPGGAQLKMPMAADFEVLSRSDSTVQLSYGVSSNGQGTFKRVQRYTIMLRANRAGKLIIPPSILTAGTRTWKTEALKIDVVKGRTQAPPDPQAQNPRGAFPGFQMPPGMQLPPGFLDPFGDDDSPFGGVPVPDQIPRSDSDLFLKSFIDKDEAWVGEQVTYSVYIYSRVDLSSVDAVVMPKLEGFWGETLKEPTTLMPESATISGVPYRRYLLRRRALFAVKPGTLTIDAVEADITTGFLYQGHRVHRRSNGLTFKAKPLPKGPNSTNIGRWRLSTQLSQSQISLGDPVTVRVVLEGRGNVKNVEMPKLTGPAALKIYEPNIKDEVNDSRPQLGGQRTVEYVVVPQQSGSFTLPGLEFPFFNVETGKWEVSKTDPLQLTVSVGAGGGTVIGTGAAGTPQALDPSQRNQLVAAGLKPLRVTSRFEPPRTPVWSRPYFLPAALAPLVFGFGFLLISGVRSAMGGPNEEADKRRQAKAARARLAAAVKLKDTGKTADFYAEVEKSLTSFLEARLGRSVKGLTRDQLVAMMTESKVSAVAQKRVLGVFETCDLGRFAPGMGDPSARERAIEDAVQTMESWGVA